MEDPIRKTLIVAAMVYDIEVYGNVRNVVGMVYDLGLSSIGKC